jgi:hypothetical protein
MSNPKGKRAPRLPGHKCAGVYVSVGCECGWTSGRGRSRRDAYADWRFHVDRHRKAAAGELPCACYGHTGTDGAYVHERGCGVKAQQDRQAWLAAQTKSEGAS